MNITKKDENDKKLIARIIGDRKNENE